MGTGNKVGAVGRRERREYPLYKQAAAILQSTFEFIPYLYRSGRVSTEDAYDRVQASMSDCVWLLRHGATEWTQDGRHTGREDVPLSDVGRRQARIAGHHLAGRRFAHVLVSPQTRAMETCELSGFGDGAETREELVEWDYGEYEGLTDEQTQQRHPGWDLFRDGCPGGESPEQVTARVDRFLVAVNDLEGICLLVAHGKLLRALGARWIGRDVALGSALPLDPAAISQLEREPAGPLLRLWNFAGQVGPAADVS